MVITIIVLLILAGITIGNLTGSNGIIKQTKEAKEQEEISNEREIIEFSVVQAMEKDKTGNITQELLQERLDKNVGEKKTEVITSGEIIGVLFVEKNRYYEIDQNGDIGDAQTPIKDDNPGDITKAGTLTGDVDKPYKINCIEDLVDFSNRVNNGENFVNKLVELARTLDFNSVVSYVDCKTKKYGDLNQNGVTEEVKTELTTGIGFTPIGNETYAYKGNFEGNNFEIKNLYVEAEGYAGLFGNISNYGTKAEIQNLTITGKVKSTQKAARRIGWKYIDIYAWFFYT